MLDLPDFGSMDWPNAARKEEELDWIPFDPSEGDDEICLKRLTLDEGEDFLFDIVLVT